ncbi:hypothetical protein [Foetidibacter luteolus]|uniref:hypothetical protein n=1 Tax=Foetidibacter luteolus TaxID=2608880 RepID=UPI00129B771F|nr:hypothetical protein [Foetidibacter luteolus]
MKKVFLIATCVLALFAVTFAGTGKLKFRGADKFLNHFPEATDVAAKTVGEFTKVSFKNNDVKTEAFYDQNGELIATSHNVDLKVIPAVAMEKITKKYQGAVFTEAIEFNKLNDGISNFYVAIEQSGKKTILEVTANGSVRPYNK